MPKPTRNIHVHVYEELAPEVVKLVSRVDQLERKLAMANAEIKKIRKAFDRIKADEVKEDADAATYRAEKEAKIAELSAKIAELEAMPTLDAEDVEDLAALRAELETISPPLPDDPIDDEDEPSIEPV